GDAGDRDEAGRAVVQRGRPPGVRAAAGAAGHTDLGHVHFGPRLQVVEGADAVSRLDAGRRVPAADPPPPAEAVGAVVERLDLAELERVEDQAAVPFAGEPGRVVLIAGLGPVGDAVELDRAVPADVEDG